MYNYFDYLVFNLQPEFGPNLQSTKYPPSLKFEMFFVDMFTFWIWISIFKNFAVSNVEMQIVRKLTL